MRLDRAHGIARAFWHPFIGAVAAISAWVYVLVYVLSVPAQADPVNDATARLQELSREAEQTTEQMHAAQLDLNRKLADQRAAEARQAADQSAADAARAQLASYQASVDKFAAATYMGGRTDGLVAIMTADSPQHLIDRLSVQQAIATEMAAQMKSFRAAGEQAAAAEQASAKSAAEARTAAEQAAAVRAQMRAKQAQLQLQIAVVKSQYLTLTPVQRTVLAGPVPAPAALPGAAPDAAPPFGDAPAPDAAPPFGDAPAPDAMPGGAPDALPGGPVGYGGGQLAVQAALTRVGSPYAWGAGGPGAFDCSGLVMWSFQQAGLGLPHSSQAQSAGGVPVARSDLQPGDVIAYYGDASHVGLYVGDGMVVHSSTYGQPVRVVPLDAAGPFHNARRY